MAIDLRKCKPGDKLISCHETELTYLRYNSDGHFPHIVQYPKDKEFRGSEGSRYDDGQVYHNIKMDFDHDIVRVIRGKRVMQVLNSKPKKTKKNTNE